MNWSRFSNPMPWQRKRLMSRDGKLYVTFEYEFADGKRRAFWYPTGVSTRDHFATFPDDGYPARCHLDLGGLCEVDIGAQQPFEIRMERSAGGAAFSEES